MNLKNYAEKLVKRNIIVFALIDLKREIKVDIVSVIKAKVHILNAPLKQHLFD